MVVLRQRLTTVSLLLLLLTLSSTTVEAWHKCSSESSDICPTGNTCCFHPPTHSYRCLSGKNSILGQCCEDETTGRTGCGDGFECAGGGNGHEEGNNLYCARIDADNDLLPPRVPRYQLCSLQPQALQEVHSLVMMEDTSSISNQEEEHDDQQQQQSSPQPAAAYLSNMGSLDTDDPSLRQAHALVDTAWIVVHGSERNADDYLCCAHQAAASQKNVSTVFIVAPWFLAPNDNVTTATTAIGDTSSATRHDNHNPKQPMPVLLRWAEEGPIPHTWRYGADDVTDAHISSYAVVDALVNRFLNTSQFPLLQRIIVAGHSAGGQLVQRWALLSPYPKTPTSSNTVSIRSVVANPKSFAWLDGRRVMEDGVVLRIPDPDAVYLCPTYNEWEWGLHNSTPSTERAALVAPYKDRAIQNAGSIAALLARYASRQVIYLAGELDVLRNGECEDKMQGRFRFERSGHFFTALREIFGGRPVDHHRVVVMGVHHDHCLMFQSPEGIKALFGDFDSSESEERGSLRDPNSTLSRFLRT